MNKWGKYIMDEGKGINEGFQWTGGSTEIRPHRGVTTFYCIICAL